MVLPTWIEEAAAGKRIPVFAPGVRKILQKLETQPPSTSTCGCKLNDVNKQSKKTSVSST
jgi:hypothetical protein